MNKNVLKQIVEATAKNENFYVSAADGKPLMSHNPPLIEVNPKQTDPNDVTKIAARATTAGVEYINSNSEGKSVSGGYSVETGGFVAPKAKRGGGSNGAPPKYNFDTMDVNAFFFVPNDDVKGGDAVKTVGSAVGAANQRYSEPTGENKIVTRAKRDSKNKAVKDANGNVEKETVTIPVKRSLRHFKVSRVEAGKQYGSWTAPADGAVVSRAT